MNPQLPVPRLVPAIRLSAKSWGRVTDLNYRAMITAAILPVKLPATEIESVTFWEMTT